MTECLECERVAAYAGVLDIGGGLPELPEVDPRGEELTRWSGMVAPWEVPTGDRRTFARDSLEHRELPMALKWQRTDDGGHKSSIVVGTVEGIDYREDGVYAWGILLDPDPGVMPRLAEDVAEARLLLGKKTIAPSVDLSAMTAEALDPDGEYAASGTRPDIRVNAGEIGAVTLVPVAAFGEVRPFALDQIPVGEYEALTASVRAAVPVRRDWSDVPVALVSWDPGEWIAADVEGTEDNLVASALYQGGQPLFPVGAFRNGELHLVPGAVADAVSVFALYEDRLPFDAETRDVMKRALVGLAERCDLPAPPWAPPRLAGLVASAVPIAPPDEWFATPEPAHLQPIVVTPEGRVYGHIGDKNVCHTGFPGECKRIPSSPTNYAYAHQGSVITASGKTVRIGRVTVGGGHADTKYGARAAQAHYDDASTVAAVGRFSDGRHGVWFSGAAVPESSEAQLAQLRRHPPSGDWRMIGGARELILAHSVNAPGFPVASYSMTGDEVTSLVAAGYVPPAEIDPDDQAAAAAAAFRRKAADKAAARFQGKG